MFSEPVIGGREAGNHAAPVGAPEAGRMKLALVAGASTMLKTLLSRSSELEEL